MSTRGAIGFRINEVDKVAYNHSDSYPSWLGKKVLKFVADNTIEELRIAAARIEFINDKVPPTKAQQAECANFFDGNVDDGKRSNWYCLLRKAQGDLNAFTKKRLRYMNDNSAFLSDSLFCEWAYIINLDSLKLEVYRGFNKKPTGAGRYATLCDPSPDEQRKTYGREPYYGVVLITEESLDNIRKDLDPQTTGAVIIEKIINSITDGWERIANDQREAEDRVEKEKADEKALVKKHATKRKRAKA